LFCAKNLRGAAVTKIVVKMSKKVARNWVSSGSKQVYLAAPGPGKPVGPARSVHPNPPPKSSSCCY